MKVLLLIVSLTSAIFCQAQKPKKHKKRDKQEQAIPSPISTQPINNVSSDCDPALEKYVYNPARLTMIEKCVIVTGIIEESSANDDGDHHILLKLDKGQENLLTKVNIKKKQGNLVIEAVCANKTSLKKVGSICNGFVNKVQIPKLGTHVKVTGSLVNDTHNGWNEIHPITKIEILK